MPIISVLMGTCNERKRIQVAQSIDSILGQTFQDFEFIICDDGSNMKFFRWLQEYCRKDVRIILLRNEKNCGLAATLNRCLGHASGEYIARMDADDISKSDRFEKQITFLRQNPEYAMVGCYAQLICESGVWGERRLEKVPHNISFLKTSPFIHPAVMIRRKVMEELNGYRELKKLLRVEDYDFFMRLYTEGYRGYNLPEILFEYREDIYSYKKRKYRYRINECRLRYYGFQKLGILKGNMRYVIKPLAAGLVLPVLANMYKKKQFTSSKCKMDICFFGFVTWIMEKASSMKIKKLFFFTREGEFFKAIFDEVKKYYPYMRELPEAEIVEVSRMSTFMPSLREITPEEFSRIWNQYPEQSMEALFKSLDIEQCKVRKYLQRYQIQSDETVQCLRANGKIRKLFQDKEFVSRMELERNKKREMLYAYLESKGWSRQQRDIIGIVDIGWKGTIQDNLCFLFQDIKIVGFYMGIQPFLSLQPLNAEKYGYMDDYDLKGSILLTVRPLEMLCNSPNGSVTGYEFKNTKICAIRKKTAQEDAVFYSYTKKEQQKIRSEMYQYCIQMKERGYHASDYKKKALRTLYRFIAYPDRSTVKAYFSLKHNEEFGVGTCVDVKTKFRPDVMTGIFCGREGIKKVKEILKESSWPQGYLVRYWLYPVLKIYNYLLAEYIKKNKRE